MIKRTRFVVGNFEVRVMSRKRDVRTLDGTWEDADVSEVLFHMNLLVTRPTLSSSASHCDMKRRNVSRDGHE